MPLKLFINGKQADLDPAQVIAQTKQVNDLNSIQDRQANYTNKFKLPKTANNLQIMDFLTVTGNTSAVPYKKNECSLYSDNGQCFIYKGYATVTDGGDYYDVVVYDGIIDLYKDIENKNLSELSLTELVHAKTVATVKDTWDSNLPYRYILADYNGNIGNVATNTVNIEYLVPSVNVKYLWDKIFTKYNATYSGAVFNTANFKNLWMTYPKGLASSAENDHIMFHSNNLVPQGGLSNGYYRARFLNTTLNHLASNADNIYLRPGAAGSYRIEIKGVLHGKRFNDPQNARLYVARNIESLGAALNLSTIWVEIADNVPAGQGFDYSSNVFQLGINDSVAVCITRVSAAAGGTGSYTLNMNDSNNKLEVKLIRIDPTYVDFTQALTDFSVRDFFTEVLHRFGLTMHKDKYNRFDAATGTYKPHYTFLTLQEQLQGAEIVDWGSKFSRKLKEDYIYGSYARRNWLRYNYNDKESSHSDWYIDVDNINLTDSRDIIKSKIYSPEKLLNNNFFVRPSYIYKLWDKELKEGQELPEYKSLDKRYYFIRAQVALAPNGLTLRSDATGQSLPASLCYVDSYSKLSFQDIVQDYYAPLERIVNSSLLVSAEMHLDENDICNFDFKKLYHIPQLSNYFLVNKINNYVPGKLVKVDMVRVHYSDELFESRPLRITKVVVTNYVIQVFFENDTGINNCNLMVHNNANGNFYLGYYAYANPMHADLPPSGTYRIHMAAGEHTSNVVIVTPGYNVNETITPQF